jgi:SEC-C motif-containing protein
MTAPNPAPCPCDAARRYADCCGRWHAGALHLQAPTAEALMRSRYSAFVLALADYLADTWHPSTRPAGPVSFTPGVRWLGLELRHHVLRDADHATVEFVARSKYGGRADRMHETSRFVRTGGRWFYLDDGPARAAGARPGPPRQPVAVGAPKRTA